MAGNTITFDSEYMRTYEKNVARAKQLVDEAQACLKRANRHDGWKCAERQTVNSSLGDLSSRLARVSNGLRETSASLTKGAGQFADLENRAQREETAAFNRLNSDYGFTANKWGGGQTNLPVTQVPGFGDRLALLAGKLIDPIFLARFGVVVLGNVLGLLSGGAKAVVSIIPFAGSGVEFISSVMKASSSLPADASARERLQAMADAGLVSFTSIQINNMAEEVVKEVLGKTAGFYYKAAKAAIDAVPVAIEDKNLITKDLLSRFESIFGKDPDGLLDSSANYGL